MQKYIYYYCCYYYYYYYYYYHYQRHPSPRIDAIYKQKFQALHDGVLRLYNVAETSS